MSKQSSDLLFYVQASELIGLGHLRRASSLIMTLKKLNLNCSLYLNADSYALEKASSLGLSYITAVPNCFSALVIDAISIDSAHLALLSQFYPRILISPVFDDANIASHVLLRSSSSSLCPNLSANVCLSIKRDYAFATAHGLCLRKLEFDFLEIGLCLSGGLHSIDPIRVLNSLLDLPNVSKIWLIDPRLSPAISIPFEHVCHSVRPWDFFKSINVFIGGTGVMLAESIAQGIPSVSLTNSTINNKNLALQQSGALCSIVADLDLSRRLQALLADRQLLENMHRSAIDLNGIACADLLARDIQLIIQENF